MRNQTTRVPPTVAVNKPGPNSLDNDKGLVPAIGADRIPSIHVVVSGNGTQVQPAKPAGTPKK
jgi:hypothetical protein